MFLILCTVNMKNSAHCPSDAPFGADASAVIEFQFQELSSHFTVFTFKTPRRCLRIFHNQDSLPGPIGTRYVPWFASVAPRAHNVNALGTSLFTFYLSLRDRPMTSSDFTNSQTSWPELPLSAWVDTCSTLHMWTQVVGKVRLALCPPINHWWEVPLYVNSVGLTTSPLPYEAGVFEVQFDFLRHHLSIQTSRGATQLLPLKPRSVADFYREFIAALQSLGIHVKIWTTPVEIPNPIPFEQDTQHASYDPEYASRFWRILLAVDSIFKDFRSDFVGKASPVHFFWGSFDLAVTRFSGRRAPLREGADPITREAYSHEVISAGFWPGSGEINYAAFYAYAAPEPAGFSVAKVQPAGAFYHPQLHEFLLKYDDARNAASPREALLAFLQSTYDAGANLGDWNRKELERADKTPLLQAG